jgi:hypothetical protein
MASCQSRDRSASSYLRINPDVEIRDETVVRPMTGSRFVSASPLRISHISANLQPGRDLMCLLSVSQVRRAALTVFGSRMQVFGPHK